MLNKAIEESGRSSDNQSSQIHKDLVIITDLAKTDIKMAADKYQHVYSTMTNQIKVSTAICGEKSTRIDKIEEDILDLAREKKLFEA
jgi:hypothetical protein